MKNEKIQCAHYASSYLPLTENWIYRIVTCVTKTTPIFLSRKKQNLQLYPFSSLYSLQDFSLPRQYSEILFFKLFGYFLYFKRICKQKGIQLLHVHFGYHGVKLMGLAKTLDIPMICSFYGDDAFARHHRYKYKNLFREVDLLLVLGPYMKQQLVSLGCNPDKIVVHHMGVDMGAIKYVQRIHHGNKIRLMMSSSLLPKKGITVALSALAALKNYEFHLDIIGDGPLRDALKAQAVRDGLEDRITWHGYQPYQYVIETAYSCDVFILSSLTTENDNKEGTPMAIVDAMATGMAVVSTKHSDIPEIVKDGEHGYLAEENNVESLRQCLEQIFKHPEKIPVFSQQARAHVEKEFNAEIQGERLEALYARLVQR